MTSAIRILLVDESRDEREMYAETFRQAGYCTLQTDNARDACRLAAELPPQVVVTEVRLAGQVNGFALARQLKSEASTRGAAIVVLSGYESSRYREAATHAGCAAFLVKPCLPTELLDTVAELVPSGALTRRSLE